MMQYTDLVEPFGIDESWLDITGSLHLFGGDAKALADEIRRVLREELGLTVSVGVSLQQDLRQDGQRLQEAGCHHRHLQGKISRKYCGRWT